MYLNILPNGDMAIIKLISNTNYSYPLLFLFSDGTIKVVNLTLNDFINTQKSSYQIISSRNLFIIWDLGHQKCKLYNIIL